MRLPDNPLMFCGREDDTNSIVSIIRHRRRRHRSARIALLGPGGIGKTAIALAVLHHADIRESFESRRHLVSCEAADSPDGLRREIALTLGLDVARGNTWSAKDVSDIEAILCLDGLESSMKDDAAATGSLLGELAGLPGLTIGLAILRNNH